MHFLLYLIFLRQNVATTVRYKSRRKRKKYQAIILILSPAKKSYPRPLLVQKQNYFPSSRAVSIGHVAATFILSSI